jgi:hypothetical protein
MAVGRAALLTRPDDPMHPGYVGKIEAVIGMLWIETAQLDPASRPAGEMFCHDLTPRRSNNDAIASAD